eukprot:TRINITY_DN695_c0_g1_i1.p1 TRINITY_DN695_c0_g1~~TRINITY_DN695_c0_g1_i1.p1  ORF type:complete len:211 (-),score=42.16 TRINITY_DN695_c0_g1_i1:118-750(-)
MSSYYIPEKWETRGTMIAGVVAIIFVSIAMGTDYWEGGRYIATGELYKYRVDYGIGLVRGKLNVRVTNINSGALVAEYDEETDHKDCQDEYEECDKYAEIGDTCLGVLSVSIVTIVVSMLATLKSRNRKLITALWIVSALFIAVAFGSYADKRPDDYPVPNQDFSLVAVYITDKDYAFSFILCVLAFVICTCCGISWTMTNEGSTYESYH